MAKDEGQRNVVAHEYGFIDYHIVWRALSDVLPNDVTAIKRISNRIEVSGCCGRSHTLRPIYCCCGEQLLASSMVVTERFAHAQNPPDPEHNQLVDMPQRRDLMY